MLKKFILSNSLSLFSVSLHFFITNSYYLLPISTVGSFNIVNKGTKTGDWSLQLKTHFNPFPVCMRLVSLFVPIALALLGLIAAPLTGVLKDETPSCLLDI